MAVVKITQFGGEMPSASSRNIPLERARTSVNLLARVPEFRPLRADVQVSTTTQTDAKSMILLPRTPDGSGGSTITTDPTNPDNWLSLPEHSNFVVGQSSDYPARVYLTADGSGYSNAQAAADIAARLDMGSAPDALTAFAFDHTTIPKVIKQLGVPRPASAPAGTATVVGEYSTHCKKRKAIFCHAVHWPYLSLIVHVFSGRKIALAKFFTALHVCNGAQNAFVLAFESRCNLQAGGSWVVRYSM